MPDFINRIVAVRSEMERRGISVLFLPDSSSREYVTGIRHDVGDPTETNRPGDWISGVYIGLTGGPIVVEPRMGSDRMERQLEHLPWITDLRILGEPDDYSGVMARIVGELRDGRGDIAVGDRTWAKSVIDLLHAAPGAKIINAHDFISSMRMVKDEAEQAVMRANARLTDDVYEAILPRLALGMSEQEIAWVVEREIHERGGEFVSFHTGIRIGGGSASREGSIHDSITAQRLERGTVLAFDFGLLKDGYCSDFGRTVFIGDPTDEQRVVYDLVIRAQAAAIAVMRDGEITAAELDRVARSMIAEAGYGPQFIHRLGHSIGKDVHEPPFLLEGDETTLCTGMCFTIEPSVFMSDGAFVRVEDVVMVTQDGGENFNTTGHDIRVLDL